MKRNNKGFTLAELLIVIAIIAILIAIAIPVFAGQLDNARIQTDHANMRSAYAVAQVANLEGGIYEGTGETITPTPSTVSAADTFYFMADGSIMSSDYTSYNKANVYLLKATVKDGDIAKCASSSICAHTAHSTHIAGKAVAVVLGTDGKYSAQIVNAPA